MNKLENKYYGQNREDKTISEYFGSFKGNLLSIGENDGVTLSNCRYLLQNGWTGILVEPSMHAFDRLHELYWGSYHIWAFNVAIGPFVGETDLFESGEHLGKGDIGLLSSIKQETIAKWEKTTSFNKRKTLVWTFEELQKNVGNIGRDHKYQFINIDCEGADLEVLKQIDLNEVNCQCLCIEHNSVLSVYNEIREYCNFFRLSKEILKNAENTILVRP